MTNDIMQCPFCELAGPASTWSHHMVSAHGWKKPGEVFTELVHDGGKQVDAPRSLSIEIAVGTKLRILVRRPVDVPAVSGGVRV